jgi:tellurite resistance protein
MEFIIGIIVFFIAIGVIGSVIEGIKKTLKPKKISFEECAIQAALLVSASDDDIDRSELLAIRKWVNTRVEMIRQAGKSIDEFRDIADIAAELQQEKFTNYIKECHIKVTNNSVDIYDTLKSIDNIVDDESQKYDLFQLCLDVANADGIADKREIAILDKITNTYLKLNKEKSQAMIEKSLPINIHQDKSNNKESIIGITNDMTNDEKQAHIRKQYMKWNTRTTSDEPKVREQAEEMINIIAELRTKYNE